MDTAINEDASRCLRVGNEEAGGVVLIVGARFDQVRFAQDVLHRRDRIDEAFRGLLLSIGRLPI